MTVVSGEILRRAGEINRDVPVMEGVVEEMNVFPQTEMLVGLHRLLESPFVVMTVKNARLRHDPAALQNRRQPLHLFPNLGDFLIDPAVRLAVMAQHSAVKLLRSDAGLSPEEVQNAAGAPRNHLVGEQADHSGTNERIDILPVRLRRFLLDHPEAAVPIGRTNFGLLEGTEHVNLAGILRRFGVHRDVADDGHEIDGCGHVEVVELPIQAPKIGGHRDFRRQFMEQVRLHPHKGDTSIAGEPPPVRHQSRIVHCRSGHRHRDLVPVADHLPPKPASDQIVETLDRLVFCLEPGNPISAGFFVERRLGVVTADPVVDLPGDQLRVIAQGVGHGADDPFAEVPIDVAVQAARAAGPGVPPQTVFIDRQDFGAFWPAKWAERPSVPARL